MEKPPWTGVLIGDCVVPEVVEEDSSDDVAETEPKGGAATDR